MTSLFPSGVGNYRAHPFPNFWIKERVIEVVRFRQIRIVNNHAKP